MMENIRTNLQPQSPQSDYKLCRKCLKEFPATLEFFYRNKGGKFGLTPRCKPCVNEDNKANHQRALQNDPIRVRALANARAVKNYHKDIERSRRRQCEAQARARKDPIRGERIKADKRAGGARLTPDEIATIFKNQGESCAICQSSDPGSKIGWNLDHCHKTGRVRFILCAHCNRGLGAFKDNPELMRKAASMLEI